MKVYCKDCKHGKPYRRDESCGQNSMSSSYIAGYNCTKIDNIFTATEDNYFQPYIEKVYLKKASEINKNNDCPDYEQKIFTDIRKYATCTIVSGISFFVTLCFIDKNALILFITIPLLIPFIGGAVFFLCEFENIGE